MKLDSRLSLALHALAHLVKAAGPLTSDAMARRIGANPVVLRRAMAGLREAGIVRSKSGEGGGWTLQADAPRLTLADVYDALPVSALFALGHHRKRPASPAERLIRRTLDEALQSAEATLIAQLRRVRISDLAGLDLPAPDGGTSSPATKRRTPEALAPGVHR